VTKFAITSSILVYSPDLAKGKTKEESLLWCISEIRKDIPNWVAEYDITFFKI